MPFHTDKINVFNRVPALCIRILAFAALALTQGCSDIIPGLNIRSSGAEEHQYSIVSNQDGSGYNVVPGSNLPPYRLIELSPDVLKALESNRPPEFDATLPAILPSDVPPEYLIGPGDILYVTVWDHPELTTPSGPVTDLASVSSLVQTQQNYVQGRLVAADGTLFFPYVGLIGVAGRTTAEVRSYLADHLKHVINNPQVDVRIIAFRASRAEVTGEVVKPGTINLDDTPKGVIQAINLCGGLSPSASRRRAVLVRRGQSYQVDLGGLISGGKPVSNPRLFPGDVLHIPDQSEDQVFVLGAVAKQEPVAMQQIALSLIQTLTEAGGLDYTRGRQTGVMVFRRQQSGTTPGIDVFTLDMSKPEGVLLASEFSMQPRDIVYVQQTAFAQYNSVITQLLPTVSTIFELNQLTK